MENLISLNVVYQQKLKAVIGHKSFLYERITSPNDCTEIAQKFWDLDAITVQESFCVLYLNTANSPICWAEIARGTVNSVVVDIRLILSHALLSNATGFVILHNHPSYNLKPSDADIKLTKEVKNAALHLNLKVLDHIIVTPDFEFYSFIENGIF